MPVISKSEDTLSTFPKLVPYEGDDVPNVVASVATRPRSRSIAQNNGPTAGSGPNGSPAPAGAGGSGAHYRRMSSSSGAANNARNYGRASMSQYQMQAIMDDANSAVAAAPTTPSKHAQANGNSNAGSDAVSPTASAKGSPPSTTTASGGAIDWGALQQQAAAQATRARTGSNSSPAPAGTGAAASAGPAFSPPTSPERGLGQRAGAVSPSTLRRLVSANRS